MRLKRCGECVENADDKMMKRKKLDFRKYGKPTERGQNVEEYMREIRENDRERRVRQ